jgi:hypothetical protein
MSAADDLKTIYEVTKDKVTSGWLTIPPTDHRLYRAFNQLAKTKYRQSENEQSKFTDVLVEKLKKASPDWHFFDFNKPDEDDLDFNYAVFSSLATAGMGRLAEYEFRGHLKSLSEKGDDSYSLAVDFLREHVADLESVAKEMSVAEGFEPETPPASRIVGGEEMAACTVENRIKKSTVMQRAMKVGRALTFRK